MKFLYLFFLILLLKFSSPIHAAHPWHWKAFGGINYYKYDHEYYPEKSDSGYILGTSLGRCIVPCFSLEAELAFRKQNIVGRWRDRYSSLSSFEIFHCKHITSSLLANTIFDIPFFTLFTPYIGAGVGVRHDYVKAHIDSEENDRLDEIKGNGWNGAYQLLGGIKFKLLPRVQTFVDYRYFDVIKLNCPESADHSVTVGIGRNF